MIECARSCGINLMVAENYRFLPALDKALDVMRTADENGIGQLRSIRIICEGYRAPSNWRRSLRRTGGGVFIDGGIHFVNLLVSLGGFPERISATWLPKVFKSSEGEDGINILARLPNGASGTVLFSRATNISKTRQHVTVDGGRGRLTFIPYGSEVILEKGATKRKIRTSKSYRGTRKMVREFQESIIENREPLMSGEKGLDDLSIVLAIYKSAESLTEVTPMNIPLRQRTGTLSKQTQKPVLIKLKHSPLVQFCFKHFGASSHLYRLKHLFNLVNSGLRYAAC